MTKVQVIKILVLIESVYLHCMTKDETVTAWFNFCAEMDYEKVMVKLQEHIRKSPYPPTIANLAVFKVEKNEFPKTLDKWIQEGRERIEHDRRSGKRNPLPDWMHEYSTRKAARS
jgi:hypothetical protein